MVRFARRRRFASTRGRKFSRAPGMRRVRQGFRSLGRRFFSRRKFSTRLKGVARGRGSNVLAAPATGRYAGSRQKTYNEYTYVFSARLVLDGAWTTVDQIQACAWLAQPFFTMAGNDSDLYAMAQAHEYMKVRYTGVSVRPEFNASGASGAINIGEMGLVPVTKDSAFKFATFATGGSPVYDPPLLNTLMNGVSGTPVPGASVITGKWKSIYQPGLTIMEQFQSPEWAGQTPASWNVPVASQWSPIWETSGADSAQELTGLKVWTPLVAFANWNATETNSWAFTIRFTVKFAFKEKRLKVGGAAVSGAGVAPDGLRFSGMNKLGGVAEDEEKKELPPASNPSPPVVHGPPKQARTDSSGGLVRSLTNVGLGVSRIPQSTPGTGVKRVGDVSMGP